MLQHFTVQSSPLGVLLSISKFLWSSSDTRHVHGSREEILALAPGMVTTPAPSTPTSTLALTNPSFLACPLIMPMLTAESTPIHSSFHMWTWFIWFSTTLKHLYDEMDQAILFSWQCMGHIVVFTVTHLPRNTASTATGQRSDYRLVSSVRWLRANERGHDGSSWSRSRSLYLWAIQQYVSTCVIWPSTTLNLAHNISLLCTVKGEITNLNFFNIFRVRFQATSSYSGFTTQRGAILYQVRLSACLTNNDFVTGHFFRNLFCKRFRNYSVKLDKNWTMQLHRNDWKRWEHTMKHLFKQRFEHPSTPPGP